MRRAVQQTSRAKRKRCLAPRFHHSFPSGLARLRALSFLQNPLPTAPALSEGDAEVSIAFDSPEPREDYRDTHDIPPRVPPCPPPEGASTVRRCRPTPCRQLSTAVAGADQGAPSRCLGSERTSRSSKTPRGSAASSTVSFLEKSLLPVEWRRGVGRQARQSGGRIVLLYDRLSKTCILKRGTSQRYHAGYRTASLFDSPDNHLAQA
jgi:hypothetical protein